MDKGKFLRLWAGKLGLMAMAVGAVLSVSSCADDEVLSQVDKTPLKISVNTEMGDSRALIHDEYFPAGSVIGLSLYNSSDGKDYDGQGYSNVKFTSTGEADKQTWAPDGAAPSVSSNEATVVAYYPWSDKVTDLTTVPVETASQTDYMYSGPVTGITNTNADQVQITMQHALTDIRVQLVLGDYSGNAEVEEVAVASPGLALSAIMNAYDGSLTDIQGKGDAFTMPVDFELSTSGTSNDIMFVPDNSVQTGTTIVSAVIGGKKYTAGINFDDVYLQGYVYTYILTLNNTGLSVTKVNVMPWDKGKDASDELQIYIPDDQYIVEIQVPSDNYTFTHNAYMFKGTIDWGDKQTTEFKNSTTQPQHTYTKAGTYVVKAKGQMYGVKNRTLGSGYINAVDNVITKLIKIGKEMGVTSMDYAFYKCSSLQSISEGALDGCGKVTTFNYAFQNCSGLTALPDGILDYCTEITDFYGVFGHCSNLTTIPEGLFDHCTKITGITNVFQYCSSLQAIPEGLFAGCAEVTSFQEVFLNCSSIKNLPKGLFDNNTKVKSFYGTFEGCSSITAEIPEGLFDNCTKVTDFGDTFKGCTNLTKVPEGLFDNCTKVTSFSNAFYGCSKITEIPEGLFDKCTEVTTFVGTFLRTGISAIPVGLFDNNTKVTKISDNWSYESCFTACSNLKSIPEGLFDKFTEVTDLSHVFKECINLQEIPEGLFDKCTKVTTFFYAFKGCTSLTEIPEGLFDNCPVVTNFANAFQQCTNLKTVPSNLFRYNTAVTSFGSTFGYSGLTSIPEGLFDNCPEVLDFSYAFSNCTNLITVPEGLFDECKKVTNFGGAFQWSSKITGESPYTTINVDGQDMKVHLYERSNYPEHFTAPTSNYSCFYNCSRLTDYSSIPSGWK